MSFNPDSRKNQAVFLDRDGVITQDPPHYAHRIDQLQLIPKAVDAIKMLNNQGFKTVVISNQSGVARGYYPETDIVVFNEAMKSLLADGGAYLDAIYYCPHHPEAVVPGYRIMCECRKPKPGMLLTASREMNIDLELSYVIGDKWSDIEAGNTAGCRTILVLTGHGRDELQKRAVRVDRICENLYESVLKILANQV